MNADPRSPVRRKRRRPIRPLAVGARELAAMLSLGLRTVRTLDRMGRLPAPLKLGARTLWNVAEIRAWLDAGSPDRATWERIKAAKK